jgi:hypothetical protein
MPPRYIPHKVEDIIFYYYAKLIISPSAGFKKNYGFIIDAYKRLKSGEIRMSDYERELLHLADMQDACAFCGSKCDSTQMTHIMPRSFGVQPGMHNIVYACKACATSKGERDLVKWWCIDLNKAQDEIPRVPLAMYLKIAYDLHRINFSLKLNCQSLEQLMTLLQK